MDGHGHGHGRAPQQHVWNVHLPSLIVADQFEPEHLQGCGPGGGFPNRMIGAQSPQGGAMQCRCHHSPRRVAMRKSCMHISRRGLAALKSASADVPGQGAAGGADEMDRNEPSASWDQLMRWSRIFRTRENGRGELEKVRKIGVLGGGSFGTAMGSALARQREDLDVVMLLRDPELVEDINETHINTRYLEVGRGILSAV